MVFPECEIYVVHGGNDQLGLSGESWDSALAQLNMCLDETKQLGHEFGKARNLGSRVRCLARKGHSEAYSDYYDLRLTPEIKEFETRYGLDVVVLPVSRRNDSEDKKRKIKLAVFDMDSTLIEQEVIDELAREIGKYDEVAAITERAMRGELDFAGSLRARVALLKGLPLDIWDRVKTRITFAQGTRAFCRELKRQGATMAVLSGGFTPLAEWVKSELGLDYAHANFLAESTDADGKWFLNGELVDGKPIVTAELKRELLLQIADKHQVELADVVCVGDGSNDLKMLGEVGKGGGIAIALKAKPRVQHEAPNKLNSSPMTDILYLLGYTQAEIEQAEDAVRVE